MGSPLASTYLVVIVEHSHKLIFVFEIDRKVELKEMYGIRCKWLWQGGELILELLILGKYAYSHTKWMCRVCFKRFSMLGWLYL